MALSAYQLGLQDDVPASRTTIEAIGTEVPRVLTEEQADKLVELVSGHLRAALDKLREAAYESGERSYNILNGPTKTSLKKWAGPLRKEAETGKKTWASWIQLGADLDEDIQYQADVAYDAGPFQSYMKEVGQNLRDLRDALERPFQPERWPTWVKVLGGLAAVGGAVAVYRSWHDRTDYEGMPKAEEAAEE